MDRAVQVLTNLLTNALRYMPAPGTVRFPCVVSMMSSSFW
jgi:signal transduction histidine kinase